MSETEILDEMSKIYTLFTSKEVIVNKETGEIAEIRASWTNPDAESLFNKLQELLKILRDNKESDFMNQLTKSFPPKPSASR